jgi:hypothetical protein
MERMRPHAHLESLAKATVELQGFRAPTRWAKFDKYVDQVIQRC